MLITRNIIDYFGDDLYENNTDTIVNESNDDAFLYFFYYFLIHETLLEIIKKQIDDSISICDKEITD